MGVSQSLITMLFQFIVDKYNWFGNGFSFPILADGCFQAQGFFFGNLEKFCGGWGENAVSVVAHRKRPGKGWVFQMEKTDLII